MGQSIPRQNPPERRRLWRPGGAKGQGPTRASAVAPICLIVAVAIVCIVVAVFSSAQRADEVAVAQEQQRVARAIAEFGEQGLRAVESVANSDLAVRNVRQVFDVDWVNVHIGQRLSTFFGQNYVFVADAAGRYVYAAKDGRRIDPALHPDLRRDLDGVLESMRLRSVSAQGSQPRRQASARTIRLFAGRPAMVTASAIVPMQPSVAVPSGPAPIVLAVQFLDKPTVAEIGARVELPSLRLLQSGAVPLKDDHLLRLVDNDDTTVATLAWTPKRPGAEIVRNVLPYIAIALGEFLILAGFILRYMQKTTAKLSESERKMRHLALHDAMSGLPNRMAFTQGLEAAMQEARSGGPEAAVLMVDLDHFKDVNDTLGHHIGDALIESVASRLRGALRGDDIVARLGGDEFAVVTHGPVAADALAAMAERVIDTLRAPYSIMGHSIVIGASIGVTLLDRQIETAAEAIRRADIALYRAKNEGRNRFCLYGEAMDAELRERKQIETDLRAALDNDAMAIAYQPVMSADGERIVGIEALCRWPRSDGVEIDTAKFISVAEDSGLIIPLGEWVLRRACRDARDWDGLPVAVNVSALQFRRPDFDRVVARILAETGFDPHRLEIELTETSLLGNLDAVEATMNRLKSLGIRFALDDFGTGYSSLLYLRKLPFHKLKVDRSFVHSVGATTETATIVHAVVSLGRGLGLTVTAEGVETAEQHLFLRAAGVHAMQGYHFGRPMPAEALTARLAAQAAAAASGAPRKAGLRQAV